MRSRGIDVKTLSATARTSRRPSQDLQGPLAKAGVKVVYGLQDDRIGIQASYNSKDGPSQAHHVGGNWYMACMPSTLIFLEQNSQDETCAIEEVAGRSAKRRSR